jgi:hypothetical protein
MKKRYAILIILFGLFQMFLGLVAKVMHYDFSMTFLKIGGFISIAGLILLFEKIFSKKK